MSSATNEQQEAVRSGTFLVESETGQPLEINYRDRWIFGGEHREPGIRGDAVGHAGCLGRIACGHAGCLGRIACGNQRGVRLLSGAGHVEEVKSLYQSTLGMLPSVTASIHELLSSRLKARSLRRKKP